MKLRGRIRDQFWISSTRRHVLQLDLFWKKRPAMSSVVDYMSKSHWLSCDLSGYMADLSYVSLTAYKTLAAQKAVTINSHNALSTTLLSIQKPSPLIHSAMLACPHAVATRYTIYVEMFLRGCSSVTHRSNVSTWLQLSDASFIRFCQATTNQPTSAAPVNFQLQ